MGPTGNPTADAMITETIDEIYAVDHHAAIDVGFGWLFESYIFSTQEERNRYFQFMIDTYNKYGGGSKKS